MKRLAVLYFFLFIPALFSSPSEALYKSINPKSIAQLLAFYELYPDTYAGKQALNQAIALLTKNQAKDIAYINIPKLDIQPLISLINKTTSEEVTLSDKQIEFIDQLAKRLANRRLSTFNNWEEKEFLDAPPDQIDLARSLFLALWGNDEASKKKIRYYESYLDLMALQIEAQLPLHPSPQQKIQAINDFVFYQQHYRFPPHSLYAKNIDLYSFLPSVIDSRKGVCLGVSILYLCIAQRLDLPLEIITPPGHIYVRYVDKEGNTLNIETTARGIHLSDSTYLGIETKTLKKRTIKEVVGLAFMNHASVFWQNEEFDKAIALYEKAATYIKEDPFLEELLAYNYLFIGKEKEAKKIFKQIPKKEDDYGMIQTRVIEDYLNKKIDAKGIKAIYQMVDETRSSIIKKQNLLQKILEDYPKFRGGLFHLANTYLQLGREKEARTILERYEKIDQSDPLVNYFLCCICFNRYDYKNAWHYYYQTRKLLARRGYFPRSLKYLYQDMIKASPDPQLPFN